MVAAALSSCSVLVDTNGLTSESAATSDGGSETGSPDADPALPTDAGTSDANVATDSGIDASTPRLCDVGAHFLCTDFDTEAIDYGFTQQNVTTGASLGPDMMLFVSPKRSLRVSVNATADEIEQRQARLARTLPNQPRRAKLTFQLNMCPVVPGDDFEIAKLQQTNGGGVKFFVNQGGGRIVITRNGQPETQLAFAKPLPNSTWVKVAIDVRYDIGPTGSVKVVLDDTNVAVDQNNVATEEMGSPVTLFRLGLWSAGPDTPCTANFDDLVLDLEN